MLALVAAWSIVAFAQPAADARLTVTKKTIESRKAGRWDGEASYPVFAPKSALTNIANKAAAIEAKKGLNEFMEFAKGDADPSDPLRPSAFSYEALHTVAIARPDLISVSWKIYADTGGAHGNTGFATMSFGWINGKPARLKLRDLFVPKADVQQLLSPKIIKKLKAMDNADWVTDGQVKQITEDQLERFVITPSGLVFLFEPYAVGPYSSGSFRVSVGFSELAGKLNPQGPLGPVLKPAR